MTLREYWDNLQQRERRMLAGGLVVGIVLLAYAGVVDPALGKFAQLRQSVHEKHVVLAWMQQAAQEVKQLNAGNSSPSDHQSLLALVDGSVRQQQLGSALKRLQPDGQSGVRVWLEQAPFDDALKWLDELAARNVHITGLTVERSVIPGLVDMRVVLEGGQ